MVHQTQTAMVVQVEEDIMVEVQVDTQSPTQWVVEEEVRVMSIRTIVLT